LRGKINGFLLQLKPFPLISTIKSAYYDNYRQKNTRFLIPTLIKDGYEVHNPSPQATNNNSFDKS